MNATVPFAVNPREVPLIWGGHTLVRSFHKPGDPNASIGESWECYDDNPALGGPYDGRTIAALRGQLGSAFVGALDPSLTFPILTKFIDAKLSLSVQVHPDDDYARRVEHQPNGKTECWVVLEAASGAEIALGWNRATSRTEFIGSVADGTLGDLLRRVPVRPGDVFYLPAGTVHSIGAGVVLYETQQTSDLTYRIFDWNRLGPDGKPRQLQVEKAADVLDYRAARHGALQHLAYELDGTRRTALVSDSRFVVERVTATTEATIELEGMPLIVTALDHAVRLDSGAGRLELAAYETGIVPAALGSVSLASAESAATALTVAPVSSADVLQRRFARAGISENAVASFLGQFAP